MNTSAHRALITDDARIVRASSRLIQCLSVALALGLDLVGRRRRDLAFRWMGAGLLVMLSSAVFSQFGHVRRWPIGHLHAIDTVNLAVALAAFACVIVGLVIRIRSQHSNGRSSYESR